MPKAVTITVRQVLEMLETQEYRCAITGRPLTPETTALDHIVPMSRGGEHRTENVWAVHAHVNAAKGTLSMEEFLAVCRDVVSGPAQAHPERWMAASAADQEAPAGAGAISDDRKDAN
jgi:hypothetical protein